MEGDEYSIRTEHTDYETKKNLKYYAQVGELRLWGCDQWRIYHCTRLACAQGPLQFLHSGVPKQTLKHLESNQELF